jgi:hypothetical protein
MADRCFYALLGEHQHEMWLRVKLIIVSETTEKHTLIIKLRQSALVMGSNDERTLLIPT